MSFSPTQSIADFALAQGIKAKARELGFDLVGIAPAERSRHRDYVRQWLDGGKAGAMSYLEKRFEERTDVRTYFPGAQSVICVAANYYTPLESAPNDHGRIARYALGDDYHEVLKTRLHQLADWIRQQVPDAQTRAAVDTAPILEREFAAQAGIGWVGKNTCVIHPRLGSWLLLGEVITTVALPIDEPITDHCGTCTRCLDTCPTAALTAPYELDASRCISYLTIEHRGEIDESLQEKIGDWLYGCDICQDVCPHNSRVEVATEPAFQPRFPSGSLNAGEVSEWSDDEYRQRLRKSAMKRVKLPVLKRNAVIVAKNAERMQTKT